MAARVKEVELEFYEDRTYNNLITAFSSSKST